MPKAHPDLKNTNQDSFASEAHYRVLRALEDNPKISQRELANQLDISLGKANYCLKALIDKGWVIARNFRNSQNKLAYAYVLTPNGINKRAQLTLRFLERKRKEFESLKHEIADLDAEVQNMNENDK